MNIKNIEIFLSKKKVFLNYEILHQFLELEEIDKSIYEITENLRRIRFKKTKPSKTKRKIIVLNADGICKLKAKDIKESQDITITNPGQKICQINSNDVKLKILLELVI